jgi:hypothetical protein
MKTYHHASVGSHDKSVYFACTDPSTTDLLVRELKTVNSDFTIVSRDTDLSGELMHVEIKFKSNQVAYQARYWFKKILCIKGWKPLGNLEFRYEIETT